MSEAIYFIHDVGWVLSVAAILSFLGFMFIIFKDLEN